MKRFDSSKLFKLTCSDIVERFHLLVSLSFVLVEDMDNSGGNSFEAVWLSSQLHSSQAQYSDEQINSRTQA